jgi:DNA-binding MarR family transcriptional regulator
LNFQEPYLPSHEILSSTSTPSTIYLVSQVHYALRTRAEVVLKPYAVTGLQFTVLSVVARHNGLSSADLSRRFYVTPQAMGQLLAGLEHRALLKRVEDAKNRRVLRISLTPAGRKLVKAGAAEIRKLEAKTLASLGEGPLQEFRSMLHTLMWTLREEPTGDSP